MCFCCEIRQGLIRFVRVSGEKLRQYRKRLSAVNVIVYVSNEYDENLFRFNEFKMKIFRCFKEFDFVYFQFHFDIH